MIECNQEKLDNNKIYKALGEVFDVAYFNWSPGSEDIQYLKDLITEAKLEYIKMYDTIRFLKIRLGEQALAGDPY